MKPTSAWVGLAISVMFGSAAAGPSFAETESYPKATLGKALLEALDAPTGSIKRELTGKTKTVLQRIIGNDASIFIEVTRLRDAPQVGCKVLSVVFRAPDALLESKDGPQRFVSPPLSFTYCRDGKPR